MEDIIHIGSITEVYKFLEAESPPHPLITIIRRWPKTNLDLTQVKFISDLYYLAMKKSVSGNFTYGRSSYDYQEGTMVFIGPGQVANFSHAAGHSDLETENLGWTILFHPDLTRKSELGQNIGQYSFFKYEINEALHLSTEESLLLSSLADSIEKEINNNQDRHSQELMVQNLETILKYCDRYYERQFDIRSFVNKDFISRFENFLRGYFASNELSEKGIPNIDRCGRALNMSGAYLSDMLRIETGSSAKDHIYAYFVEQVKTKLLNSKNSITQIAYEFGFKYPQNFTKLFKSKTGINPTEFRNLNKT